MVITYIAHSGFFIELAHTLLVFDYYQGTMPKLPANKKLYVFSSHQHADHFNPEIFDLTKDHEDTQYILSKDIWLSRVPEALQNKTVRLKSRETWTDEAITVTTLRSTDLGVAFLVECEGKTIYHAGDLNDWRWAGEEEIKNKKMTETFHRNTELLRNMHLDLAFLPLDPRQEKDYYFGMNYLLELAQIQTVFPMHFWGNPGVINRWYQEFPELAEKNHVIKIESKGQTFEIND